MKRFNLDEYLKNPSKKVVTSNGRNVRIICTDCHDDFPIIALLSEENGFEYIFQYTKDGTIFKDHSDEFDLFFVPEKHEGWINLYRTETSSQYVTSNLYNSEEKAIEIGRTSENYIATTKIEWEE